MEDGTSIELYSPLIPSNNDVNNDNDDDEEKAYEALLDRVGFGKFHVFLLLVCGWANASDAVEILCVSFVLPSAECELSLTPGDKGVLTAVIFLGMMFGGCLWGNLGDWIGRRITLVTSLLLNSFGGAISAFAGSFTLFTFARFLSGVGVGGSVPVIWSYFAEFQVARNRGTMLSLLACSWMVGNIITAGLAWILIPRKTLSLFLVFRTLSAWRIFVLLCVLPALTAALLLYFFPESPKFLIKTGRGPEAKSVLLSIKRVNDGRLGGRADDNDLQSPLFADSRDARKQHQQQRRTSLIRRCAEKILQLFRRPHAGNNAVMLVIFATISFGYYGMWLWMPELFSMAEKSGHAPCALHVFFNDSSTAPEAAAPPAEDSMTMMSTSISPTDDRCFASDATYRDSLISTVATLPGNLVSIFCVDRLGRKPLLVLSMIVSGVSVFFIPLVSTGDQLLALSCCFGGFSVIGWNALDCLSCELFPTELRSTAIGLQLGLGRVAAVVANLIFGQLIAVNCAVPILLVAACMVVGGLCSLRLPSTTGVVLS